MSDPFLAQISWVGFDFAPRGWAKCDGQLLPINQNQALYSLLGTMYGGDGRTSFALPDLRGRSIVHIGTGAGLTPVNQGQRVGTESVVLTPNELPAHSHAATVHAADFVANEQKPGGNMLASTGADSIYAPVDPKDNVAMAADSVVISPTGANQPVFNRDPFLGLNAIIATTGTFPSRN